MLAPGTRLGVYEVVAAIGAGGMGEVYRARDTRLKRDVALKILPEGFAGDGERVGRFQREAEVLAALNHPNVAQIYGNEESNGTRALVMELVEGETLAERIARGAIPLAEALPIAKQIAEALEAAHEQGIIHRDLKPANIKVRPDGTVKVLDFGLAKLADGTAAPPTGSAALSLSPTITSPAVMSGVGVLLGTAAYMSPEQAIGRGVDKRSDLWAFGVVLFEMLTARPAFDGETVSHVLASVLKDEPDWRALPEHTPSAVRRLLQRCLQKDRKRRLDSAADARLDIEDALTESPTDASHEAIAGPSHRGTRLVSLIGVFALVGVSALALIVVSRFAASPLIQAETRVDIVTPATSNPESFSLSPDGRHIVFVASSNGVSKLWLRSLGSTTAQPISGTDGAGYPFWSPDSRSVGFFAGGQLWRLDIGGVPRRLAAALAGRGGTWSSGGVILFAPANRGPLVRISSSGGSAVPATKLLDGQGNHRLPFFFPDGHHFLFYAQGTPQANGIYVGELDSDVVTRITASETSGIYLPSGWLLWVRGSTLVAQRLDLQRQALAGDVVSLADEVFGLVGNSAPVSVSATGLIAYRSGGAARQQLRWFDRAGKVLGEMGAPDENSLRSPNVSPDGNRVVVSRTVQGNTDLWILDGARSTRFTFDAGSDQFPIWSRDGSRVVFRSNRAQPEHLYVKEVSGASQETPLPGSVESSTNANDLSPDGRFLLYQVQGSNTDFDLWVVPMEGPGKRFVFAQTPYRERNGKFSPDGRWVAYMSDESGRSEIYIRPFERTISPAAQPSPSGGQWQVSTTGGVFPVWSADGRELYYIAPTGEIMAVAVTIRGDMPQLGAPTSLFAPRIFGGGFDNLQGRQFDVTRDGRFLINTVTDDASATPITLIQNWAPPKAE